MDNYEDPIEGKTYISPSLAPFQSSKNGRVRIATKLIGSPDTYAFAVVKDELVLRHKEDAKTKIIAKFLEDDRRVFVLNIQGYSVATEKPHNASFSFVGDEIDALLEFMRNIKTMPLESRSPLNITDADLKEIILTDQQAKKMFAENQELFTEVLRSDISKEDVVAVGYRKKQIEVFRKLLNSEDYFTDLQEKLNSKKEALWQRFFEKNSWIFGYGLGYIFLTGLDNEKLEKVVQGYDIEHRGKRIDAFLKTRGLITNVCFAEIKTHSTKLLENRPYRPGCWAPSKELAGAVAQVQGTVSQAVDNLSRKIALTDDLGNPTGEEVYNYQPNAFLVIGNLDEFITDAGVNEEKLRSFELYRKNTTFPEIITFDELFERAKFIVCQAEK